MFTLDFIVGHFNYWVVIVLMMAGLYVVVTRSNLVKKMVGLNVFQTSVFLFYISMGKVAKGTAPIEVGGHGDGHESPSDIVHNGVGHGGDAGGHLALSPSVPGQSPISGGELPPSHGVLGVEPLSKLDGQGFVKLDTPTVSVDSFDIPQISGMPLETAHDVVFSNPLPHVLILTAIVVGVATLAVGLAIIVRIRETYGTIEEDEILAADRAAEFGEAAPR